MKKFRMLVTFVIALFGLNVYAGVNQVQCESGGDLQAAVHKLNNFIIAGHENSRPTTNPSVSTAVVNGAVLYTVCAAHDY